MITVAEIGLVLLTAAQDWGRKYLQRLYYQLLSWLAIYTFYTHVS